MDNRAAKKSFWQRLRESAAEVDQTQAKAKALPPAGEPAEIKPAVLAQPEPVPAAVQPERPAAPETKPVQKEDASSRAARLAVEGAEKERLAALAVDEAKRAQAELRLAEREAGLYQAELKAKACQAESARAQQEASQAMVALNEAEQAHATAVKAAEDVAAELAALQEECDNRVATLVAAHAEKLDAERADLAQMEESIRSVREEAEAVLAASTEAERRQEEQEAELRRMNTEGSDAIRLAMKQAEDAHAGLAGLQRSLDLAETHFQAEEQKYDRICRELNDAEEKHSSAERRVDALREEHDKLEQELIADAEAVRQAIQTQIEQTESERAAAAQQVETCQSALEQKSAESASCSARLHELEEELRTLSLERDEAERSAKLRIAEVIAGIEEAKRSVVEKKEQYQEIQHKLEAATIESVQCNALLKRAQESVDKARAEESDAALAAEMAQKLKADAVAAKGADEASSQLLGKAEMVLNTTIDRANRLLEEKRSRRIALETAAAERQAEMEAAAAAVEQVTAQANDMIVIWLAAEEDLVKITASVEAEKKKSAQEAEAREADYADQLLALQDELSQQREVVAAAADAVQAEKSQLESAQKKLAALDAQLSDMRETAQAEISRREAEAVSARSECEARLRAAESELREATAFYDSKRREQELAAEAYRETQEKNCDEQDRLRGQLTEKKAQAQELENAAAALELKYKDALAHAKDSLEEINTEIRTAHNRASELATKMRELEQQWNDAKTTLNTHASEAEKAEEDAREQVAEQLAPKRKELDDKEERVRQLQIALEQKRNAADKAVHEAAERFAARLAAVNHVAMTRIENEIARLHEAAEPLHKEAEEKKQVYDAAESAYQQAATAAADLREAEARIKREAEEKLALIEREKTAALTALEQDLIRRAAAEEAKRAEADAAEAALRESEAAYQQAEEKQTMLADVRAKTESRIEQLLADLEERYQADVAAAAAELPGLLTARNVAAAAVQEAQAAVEDARKACEEQEQVVAGFLEQELVIPRTAGERIDALRAEKQAALNEVKTRLATLEGKEQELQEAYRVSCDYAERSEQAKINVTEYLHRLREENAAEREQVEGEIRALQDRVTARRADADEKEQHFRETEKMLVNSTAMIEAAEDARQQAQIQAAKALAELQASQAARETATNLAKQAASAFTAGDASTAEIMRRASEDLFNAAETAMALVEEKQALYEQAEQDLAQAEDNVRSVKRTIGEAPVQLEQARSIWQTAEGDYRACKQQADQEIPALRNRLSRFLEERRQDLLTAEQQVDKCENEAAASAMSMEKLGRQLMELSAEISAVAVEVQTQEVAMAEAVSAAEAEAETTLAAHKEERAVAEERAEALHHALQRQLDALEVARAAAADKENRYQQHDAAYREAYESLTTAYETARADALAEERAAVTASVEADAAWKRSADAKDEAQSRYDVAVAALAEIRSGRELKLMEQEKLHAVKQRMLQATEEERLRELGIKTIARIEAEEHAARAEAERNASRVVYEAVAKREAELLAALHDAEIALQHIRDESEKAISEAMSTTTSLIKEEKTS